MLKKKQAFLMVGGTIRFSECKGAEVRKVRKGSRKGGGCKLRRGDHKGNYLHQPAKSPIKPESTTH